jgi:hypothetical protein
VAAAAGAAACSVGAAADPVDVVLDSTGATDTVGVAALAGAAAELAAAGLDAAVLPVDDAWLSAAAVDWLDEPVLAAVEA